MEEEEEEEEEEGACHTRESDGEEDGKCGACRENETNRPGGGLTGRSAAKLGVGNTSNVNAGTSGRGTANRTTPKNNVTRQNDVKSLHKKEHLEEDLDLYLPTKRNKRRPTGQVLWIKGKLLSFYK